MGALFLCSACCMILSVWAIVQLLIMGMFYKLEATVLVEDVEPKNGAYADYDDFIKMTTENYAATAINCWIVAAIYVLTLGLSCIGLQQAKKAEKKAAVRREDDEYSCQPKKEKIME